MMKLTSHVLHEAPMKPVEQVHKHAVFPTFDVTAVARLLQFFFFLHFGEVKSSSPGLVRTAFSLNPNFWSMSPMIRNWACTPRDPQ